MHTLMNTPMNTSVNTLANTFHKTISYQAFNLDSEQIKGSIEELIGVSTEGLIGPRQNLLLASLPYSELNLWEHELELIDLKLGQILCEPGIKHTHVIFPTTAIVSLLYTTQDGTSSEVSVVGRDGVVGISVFMGGNETPNQAIVQSAGQAYRLSVKMAKTIGSKNATLLPMLLSYTQIMITQIGQTAVCNRHHTIDQQLCRRLLVGLDLSQDHDLIMTQELLSSLLGVRRESITTAALKLQEAGVISYARGHIKVLNRYLLEQRCCECYAIVKKEHKRLMPPVSHPGTTVGGVRTVLKNTNHTVMWHSQ